MRLFTKTRPAIEQILDRGLQCQFDINPVSTQNAQEHAKFAKYLKEQILQIEVWDGGADQTHFGTARVPLVRLLRQGQPSVVMPFQFDLHE